MYIDYSKIITDDFKLFITDEQLEGLKKIAKKEKECIKYKLHNDTLKYLLSSKAKEIVYVSSRYQFTNDVDKALIASNIVFDDEKTAKILANGNFDKDSLETFIKLLNILKKKIVSNKIVESDKKYVKIADNYAKKLVSHFSKYIGVCEVDIIINKINEIISFKPELLEVKQNKHVR